MQNSKFNQRAFALLAIPLCFAIQGGCREKAAAPHPITEAYSLMDQGENEKAILLLEDTVTLAPDNTEARVLLASAYAGTAGVDVYRLHSSFQDLLFQQPLSGHFWGGKDGPPGEADPEQATRQFRSLEKPDEAAKSKTPLERAIHRLDVFLNDAREIAMFLDRFPRIRPERWPLLDKALEHLMLENPTPDIRLYRSFLRVIYLKSFLDEVLFANIGLGTREWACQIRLYEFRDDLTWTSSMLFHISDDLTKVFPKRSMSLNAFHGTVEALVTELQMSQENTPSGSRTGLLALEKTIKEVFYCAEVK